jgi:hypothetical protein
MVGGGFWHADLHRFTQIFLFEIIAQIYLAPLKRWLIGKKVSFFLDLFALVSGYEVGRPRRTQHSLMNVCFMEDFAQRGR